MGKTEDSEHHEAKSFEAVAGAPDPLLESLVFLTAHFGRAKSADALTSGLAYDNKGMGPLLFCEAAERLGLRAKIVKRDLRAIPGAVLPAVLILQEQQACVLLAVKGKKAKIFLPETGEAADIAFDILQKDYAGYAIFIHPRSEFTNPETAHLADTDRHWFWGLIEENRGIYGMALLGAVFINLFGLVSPLFIMNVYDRVIPNNAIETGWALGIGALVVFVFDFIMRTLRAYLIDVASRRIDVMAARRIYDHVLNMRLAYRPVSSGSFANMLRDFDSVRDFFTSATITCLVDLPFSLFFLFIIYKLGGVLALLLVGMIFIVFMIGLILQAPLKSLVRKATQSSEAKHGLLVETIHGLETIKAIGADRLFRARYGDLLAENAAYGQGSRFVSGLGVNIATFLQQTASVILVLAGMYMVRDADLTMGGLIACVILGGRAIAPIGQVANLMTRYHQAGSALKTLDKILEKPVERPPHKQFLHRPDLRGKISFEKVSFQYPGVARKVLDNVSFTIEPGEKVAIIGRIGSGKSTIARLIMGLYEPGEGTILADDTDYRQIDPADLRRKMAYIAQDVVLFNASVRDNICASVPQAAEGDILEAAKKGGVHDFMSRHPMGYDAPVGERGEGLSGGQRQAIALARAILLKPRVMVCDEPTNAMDMQAEDSFRDFVTQQTRGSTFVLITHKHNLLSLVDRLILLDQGRVIMDGPRDKVIAALQAGKIEVPQ
jgi:ATP-binding cassette subfamily C protein LapB